MELVQTFWRTQAQKPAPVVISLVVLCSNGSDTVKTWCVALWISIAMFPLCNSDYGS